MLSRAHLVYLVIERIRVGACIRIVSTVLSALVSNSYRLKSISLGLYNIMDASRPIANQRLIDANDLKCVFIKCSSPIHGNHLLAASPRKKSFPTRLLDSINNPIIILSLQMLLKHLTAAGGSVI